MKKMQVCCKPNVVWLVVSHFGQFYFGQLPFGQFYFGQFQLGQFFLAKCNSPLYFGQVSFWPRSFRTFLFGQSLCLFGPRLWGRRTSYTQPENSKRAHLKGPALLTTSKFHEKTPKERSELAGRARNFGSPTPPFCASRHPSGP